MATGVKPSNVPLALPWLVAVWPAIPLLWRNLERGVPLVLASVIVSFAPNAFLNHKHCGDWTGMAVEPVMMKAGAPLLCVSWNVPYLVLQNITPPIFPMNAAYNRKVNNLIPNDLKTELTAHFQPEAASFRASELMMEENGPLGLGIVTLLVFGAAAARIRYRKSGSARPHRRHCFPRECLPWLVIAGTLVALVPMLMRSGLTGSGRYLAPHYLFLCLPLLLVPGLSLIFRGVLWKIAVIICFGALLVTMVINPARPLWPALTVLNSMDADASGHPTLQRALDVYETYRKRLDAFAPIRSLLPADVDRIGFFSGNTPEASLWKPFGKRRIIHILPQIHWIQSADEASSISWRASVPWRRAAFRTCRNGARNPGPNRGISGIRR